MRAPNSRNFVVGRTHIGEAVFAARRFKRGDLLMEFKGQRVHRSKVPQYHAGENDRYVQIEPNYYLGPSNDMDDLINHSCNPNSGLKFTPGKIMLVAIRNIKLGEEITWDYSSTLLDDSWHMTCECRSKNCRKVIRNFGSLDKSIQRKYLRLGIVPKYIVDSIENDLGTVYAKEAPQVRYA